MRPPAILLTTAVVLAMIGVGAAFIHGGDEGFPRAPARCAGPQSADQKTEDLRQEQWRATVDLVENDPSLAVWVGFGRTLTVEDVAVQLRSTRVQGVGLAWKQRQGTTVHAQDQFAPLAADDPAVRAGAMSVLDHSATVFPPGATGSDDPLGPVDAAVSAGAPPIVSLLITADLEDVVREHRCLIYSLLPATSGQFPALPTAIGG